MCLFSGLDDVRWPKFLANYLSTGFFLKDIVENTTWKKMIPTLFPHQRSSRDSAMLRRWQKHRSEPWPRRPQFIAPWSHQRCVPSPNTHPTSPCSCLVKIRSSVDSNPSKRQSNMADIVMGEFSLTRTHRLNADDARDVPCVFTDHWYGWRAGNCGEWTDFYVYFCFD